MRIDRRFVMRARGAAGVGFAVLGLAVVVQVALVHVPLRSKVLGFAFGFVSLGLGITRIVQYRQWRRSQPR